MPWDLIIIGGIVVAAFLWSEAGNKRHVRDLLTKNDEMWNDLIAEHQKAIAEAYQQGKGFRINIER